MTKIMLLAREGAFKRELPHIKMEDDNRDSLVLDSVKMEHEMT
jgi:hypothetical protein